jgi:plasmid stabilization system protein ParE
MSYNLIIRKRAEQHIADAYTWYEEQRIGLGEEFLLCIEASLNAISENPLLLQEKHKNIRCIMTPRFPYGIFYFIDKSKVVVISVFHLSRNPKLWRE